MPLDWWLKNNLPRDLLWTCGLWLQIYCPQLELLQLGIIWAAGPAVFSSPLSQYHSYGNLQTAADPQLLGFQALELLQPSAIQAPRQCNSPSPPPQRPQQPATQLQRQGAAPQQGPHQGQQQGQQQAQQGAGQVRQTGAAATASGSRGGTPSPLDDGEPIPRLMRICGRMQHRKAALDLLCDCRHHVWAACAPAAGL